MKKKVFDPRVCETGTEFESYVVDFLNNHHFNARRVGKNDGGVDIIATYSKDNEEFEFYIQCKFHNKVIGNSATQEVFTAIHYNEAENAYPVVISNNYMTANAQKYSYKLHVEVIDKTKINLLNKGYFEDFSNHHSMGPMLTIIVYELTQDYKLERVIQSRSFGDGTTCQKTDTTALKEELLNEFNEAINLSREYDILQIQASEKFREAVEAKKNAMLKGLEYG